MRILWSSNAPWTPTGYGVQAQYIVPRLIRAGHELAIAAWDGLHWGRLEMGGVTVYPGGYEPFGRDVIGHHAEDFGADLVVSLHDIWPLSLDYRQRLGRPWAPWFPIDHEPVSEFVIERALTAEYPMTYSKQGQEALARVGVPSLYMPFGIDTEIFQPDDRAEARAAMGLDDGFLAVIVGANLGHPSRKAFPEQMDAFARFAKRHPELDARLYIHADPDKKTGSGLDLWALARVLGIAGRVMFPDRYQYLIGFANPRMAQIYQAADVLLAATMAEGFGLPILEAQACGVPVVTTNWASMPELTRFGVVADPVQRFWIRINAWYAVPGVDNILQALETVAGWNGEETAARRQAALEWVRREFDWDVIVERYWLPFLEIVERDIKEQ